MNYSELTDLLQEYLQTTETSFVANIPNFVRQAEERINREVVIPDLRRTATGTMTSGNRYLSKPTDYLTTAALTYTDGSGNQQHLLLKDEDYIREAYPNPSTTAAPVVYAHFDDDFWIMGPTPDDNYATTIRYYYDPESIVTASTSWLGDNAESVLLYGALVEAYTYLKGDPDLVQQYNTRYQDALKNLMNLGMVRSKRDDYREGEIRQEVRV